MTRIVQGKPRCSWCGERRSADRCSRCGWQTALTEEDNGIGAGEYGLLLMGLVNPRFGATGLEGQWLEEYDPRREGTAPANSMPMLAHITATEDPAKAMRFRDVAAARRVWMRWDGTDRPDGRPSRPLTSFTIEVTRLPS